MITFDENNKPLVEIVNEQTGELETVPLESLPVSRRLTWMAREVRRLEKQKEQINQTTKEELERIGFEGKMAAERIDNTMSYLMTRAEMSLAELGDDCPKDAKNRPRFAVPGQGTFKYRAGRESVNIDQFYELPKDKAQELLDTRPDLFTVSTKYTPNKTAIKEANNRPDCFVVEKPQDKLILD